MWYVYLPSNVYIKAKVTAQDAIRVDPNVKYIISLSERPRFWIFHKLTRINLARLTKNSF
ncbi:hypothetical protein BRLA_c021530 [Brevibacillus laterosporus LMG 15441]|uniref:Uncharacterized protein n=1 Tax=Brevibacillus laterosporus LMG 15441 TaxID=1042163 RepID=A0A075R3M8_BRELA|nr:hypothetical protein BRLA_c021530 [Brevibacillus laterosporus LMG 15441]